MSRAGLRLGVLICIPSVLGVYDMDFDDLELTELKSILKPIVSNAVRNSFENSAYDLPSFQLERRPLTNPAMPHPAEQERRVQQLAQGARHPEQREIVSAWERTIKKGQSRLFEPTLEAHAGTMSQLALASTKSANHAPCIDSSTVVEVSPTLAVGVCADGVVRVVHSPPDSDYNASYLMASHKSLMLRPDWPTALPRATVVRRKRRIVVTTGSLQMRIDVKSERVSFFDASEPHTAIRRELGHKFDATTDHANGDDSYVVTQAWSSAKVARSNQLLL